MSPEYRTRVPNSAFIRFLFSPYMSLRILSFLSALSILMLADGILLLWIAQRIGGLPALAYSALVGILGGSLFAMRAGALKRKITEQASNGMVQLGLVQQYGGMVLLLIPMILPGFISSGVAFLFYLPAFCRALGWLILGINKSVASEVQQVLAR
jgi:UPF0716 family protein affecting phage T7 exclusion